MDYLMLPMTILRNKNLLMTDKLTMAVIVTHAQARYDQTTSLSVAEIHEQFPRLPERTIWRSLRRLERCKCIEIIRTPGHKNKYKVLIDIPYDPEFHRKRRMHYDQ